MWGHLRLALCALAKRAEALDRTQDRSIGSLRLYAISRDLELVARDILKIAGAI